MSVIKSLFIPCVDTSYDEMKMIEAFYCNDIATISKVTFVPYVKRGKIYYKAYLDIYMWHDTEVAYNLIKRINNPKVEARMVYKDDNWWVVEKNTLPFTHTIVNHLIERENPKFVF